MTWNIIDILIVKVVKEGANAKEPESDVSRTVVMGEGEEQKGEEGPSIMKSLPKVHTYYLKTCIKKC